MMGLDGAKFSFEVKFDDYVVRDHKVHQVRIMPGVTFIDIIYRYLISKTFNPQDIQLEKILFKSPVRVSEEFDSKVTMTIQKMDDEYKLYACSEKLINGVIVEESSVENLECLIRLDKSMTIPSINPETLLKNPFTKVDMDAVYSLARKVEINHDVFMKGLGDIHRANEYVLADIHLSTLAQKHLDYFFLHPAYLDASTLLMYEVITEDIFRDKPFIPIYIDKFKCFAPLGKSCYVKIDRDKVGIQGNDVVNGDIYIYGVDGKPVAFYEKLLLKCIREKELIKRLINEEATSKTSDNTEKAVSEKASIQNNLSDLEKLVNELKSLVGELLSTPSNEIGEEEGYYSQGLDSRHLLVMVQRIEKWIGKSLYPTLLFEYSNILDLSNYLLEKYGEECKAYLEQITAATITDKSQKTEIPSSVFMARTVWEKRARSNKASSNKAKILIIGNDKSLYNAVQINANTKPGIDLCYIGLNSSFEVLGTKEILVNRNSNVDYSKALNELANIGFIPTHIFIEGLGKEVIGSTVDIGKLPMFNVLYVVQALMKQKSMDKLKLYYHFTRTDFKKDSLHHGISGFAKTLRGENPGYRMHVVETDSQDIHDTADILLSEASMEEERVEIYYDKNKIRYTKKLTEQPLFEDRAIYSKDGVYLIAGGAGGLGLIFARFLGRKPGAKIILVGRSSLNNEKEADIIDLKKDGILVEYHQADISKKEEVQKLISSIKQRYGKLDGVIHSAGVIRDGFIITKQRENVETVLLPKVFGAMWFDEVLKDDKLDFMVFFSSIAGEVGNQGQADYAYANSFLDSFAQGIQKVRNHKKVLSINWPLWRDGGMMVDEFTIKALHDKLGLQILESADGTNVFDNALSGDTAQVVVFCGDNSKIKQVFHIEAQEKSTNIIQVDNNEASSSGAYPTVSAKNVGEIAIIGIAGRYPGADTLEEFWENLKNGVDSVTEIPKERWDYNIHYNGGEGQNSKGSKWGGFINDVDKFDPLFFNITPKEAELLDPQERLFLQTAWHSIENAGYQADTGLSNKKVGVFVGAMFGHYQLFGAEELLNGNKAPLSSSFASISNRVSYSLNLRGPSITIDTMCSSSLTAIHLACESIKRGECEMAIAGGVNVSIHPQKYIFLNEKNFTSSEGKCRAFGEGGDGYVPGEGVGAVLLKPLEKAVEDGDRILCVIKGTYLNHGGKASGFTVPNPNAQAELIEEALLSAGINPETISYIEAHGTGTSLGDPIEIMGLEKAFRKFTTRNKFCAVGSVKTNIGHCESAAGIAGLTKIIFQLKHKTLVPSIHSEKLNHNIDFDNTPFYIQRECSIWENNNELSTLRRAGLSSFGAGGANAHIIIEEFEQDTSKAEPDYNRESLLVLSARNKSNLKEYAKLLANYIEKQILLKDTRNSLTSNNLDFNMEWLKETVSEIIDIPKDKIDLEESISEYFDEPFNYVKLVERIREQFGIEFVLDEISKFGSFINLCRALPENATQPKVIIDSYLPDIAYTLQTGRKHLPERLAFTIGCIEDALVLLRDFANGENNTKIFYSAGKSNTQTLTPKDYEEGNWDAAARYFIEGGNVDFKRFYEGKRTKKLELPGYPFEKIKCWFRKKTEGVLIKRHDYASSSGFHPLINENISTFEVQEYKSVISPNLYLVKEHEANNIKLLPGAALLEIAVAAIENAANIKAEEVKDLVWHSPVIPGENELELYTRITAGETDYAFEIYSKDINKTAALHCTGVVKAGNNKYNFSDTINIKISLPEAAMLETQVYERFLKYGFKYGSSFRTIKALYSGIKEVWTRIKSDIAADGYRVKPLMLDGILQSTIGLLNENNTERFLPWKIGNIRFLDAIPDEGYVKAECLGEQDSGSLLKFNLKYFDIEGKLIIEINEFILKKVLSRIEKNRITEVHENYNEDSKQYVKETLITMICNVAKINREDAEKSDFMELGFDSVSISVLTNHINNKFGTTLIPVSLYTNNGVNSLAEKVLQEAGEKVEELYLSTEKPNKDVWNTTNRELTDEKSSSSYIPSKLHRSLKSCSNVNNPLEIAIIGMSVKFPESNNAFEFYNNLLQGKDVIKGNSNHFYSVNNDGCDRWPGAYLSDPERFNNSFFWISPREARMMDPQQRLFLQTAYNALEDAGYNPRKLAGSKTGVFVGVMNTDYHNLVMASEINKSPELLTGLGMYYVANRISYYLDLKGPSETINTACSSSIIAIIKALDSIRNRMCDIAIAGGVNLIFSVESNKLLDNAGILSKKGMCLPYDQRADGYLRGEGIGAFILKPLHKALEDKDNIYGIIKGYAENYGGNSGSLTTASSIAQAEVILRAWEMAGIEPCNIDYLETSATGSQVGDPIEFNGIKKAIFHSHKKMGTQSGEKKKIKLGAVKSHIGNLESASGAAQLACVLMGMKYGKLPGIKNLLELNDTINLSDGILEIPHKPCEWERRLIDGKYQPRRAGINSFGISGVNGHISIEEHLDINITEDCDSGRQFLYILSAKTKVQLLEYAARMGHFIKNNHTTLLPSQVAYTLQTGREAMEVRLAVIADSLINAAQTMLDFSNEKQESENCYFGEILVKPYLYKCSASTQYVQIAQEWCSGAEIDFRELYTIEAPGRVSLPAYPFSGEIFCLDLRPDLRHIALEKTGNIEKDLKETNTENEILIRNVITKALGLSCFKDDEDLLQAGINSLLIIKIRTELLSYGISLSIQDFFDNPTIDKIIQKVCGGKEILFESNNKKGEQLFKMVKPKQITANSLKYENVFLTGVTGYLGVHLLNDLLKLEGVHVYCLIRDINHAAAVKRLNEILNFYKLDHLKPFIGSRILLVRGDITEQNLGMDQIEYTELGKKVDVILHAAALVKHFGKYEEFEEVNVKGTKRVIDFANTFGKKMNYVSTIVVSGKYLGNNNGKTYSFSEEDFDVGQNIKTNVYIRSKYEAEKLLFDAMNKGLDAAIYRVGIITGRFKDGLFQKNIGENAIYKILKSYVKISAIADEFINDDMEFSPVDVLSEAMVKIMHTRESNKCVFHLFNHNTIKMSEVLNALNDFNYNISIVTNQSFYNRIESFIKNPDKSNYLEGLITTMGTNWEMGYRDGINLDSVFTEWYLENLGMTWPVIDKEYLHKIIRYMVNVGYLE